MLLKAYCLAGLGCYVLLSAADLLLTRTLLNANEEAYESNPAAAACLEQHGWSGLAVYKAVGVLVFSAAVCLIIRRQPAVAAGVVTFGCLVLVWVTSYSHALIVQTHAETADRDVAWQNGFSTDGESRWLASRSRSTLGRVEDVLEPGAKFGREPG